MAQFSTDTRIDGSLDVENEITQSTTRINVSKINDGTQVIADIDKDVQIDGQSITLNTKSFIIPYDVGENGTIVDNDIIGTTEPESISEPRQGQIYFKIIN